MTASQSIEATNSAILVTSGVRALTNTPPMDSSTLFNWFFNLARLPLKVSPAATADPPNSLFNSARIIFCASADLPVSTRFLITSCCAWLKFTPTRRRAVTPRIGSCRALPNWIEADLVSSPRACAMSSTVFVACGKISLPIEVKVSNKFSTDRTSSSENLVCFSRAVASLVTWSAVTPAALAVDFSTAFV